MLWAILTVMTLAMAAYAALPFLSPRSTEPDTGTSDVALIKDQLAEIAREEAAGTIEPAAAESARLEIKRRLLAAERTGALAHPAQPLSAVGYQYALASIVGATVLGSVGLYVALGSPSVPSAVRLPGVPAVNQASTDNQPSVADVDTAIAKVAERAKANPKDVEAWGMLGWAYLRTGRYAEALAAYRHAEPLDPKSVSIKSGLSQAIIKLADGRVTPEAMAKINEILALDPKEPGAVFDQGLAKLQAGDAKAAVEHWIAQVSDAPAGAPWVGELRQRIVEVAAENKIDVEGRLAPASPGPSPDEVAAAQALPAAERTAMIRGMVERLAAKLEADPADIDGWLKLMRSYAVLGDAGAAKAAYARAQAVFAKAPAQLENLNAAARALSITP
jgi:cytochrome c-type biogenesis protein CcmH